MVFERMKSLSSRIDWWLGECIILLIISGTVFQMVLRFDSTSGFGPQVRWWSLSFPVLLLYACVLVGDKDEKRSLAALAIASLLPHLRLLAPAANALSVFLLHCSALICSVVSYYLFRKSGQRRHLNVIRSVFGTSGKTSLYKNVAFFVSIAVSLGLSFYVFMQSVVILFAGAFILAAVAGGVLIHYAIELVNGKPNRRLFAVMVFIWILLMCLLWLHSLLKH